MKRLASVVTAFACIWASPGSAQKLDLSAMKCNQFVQSNKEYGQLIVTWYMGFHTEAEDTQVLNLAKLNDTREKLLTFCNQHPNFGLASAAESLLGE
jgi:acid stress chaperone HdeB